MAWGHLLESIQWFELLGQAFQLHPDDKKQWDVKIFSISMIAEPLLDKAKNKYFISLRSSHLVGIFFFFLKNRTGRQNMSSAMLLAQVV